MSRLTAPPPASGSYWHVSRTPRYSLTFALPLLVLYELLAAAINRGDAQGLRNGADVMLRQLVATVAGPRGPELFGIVLVLVFVVIAVRDARRSPGGVRPRILAGMLGESVVLALLFGVVVGVITAQLVASLQGLAAGPLDGMGWATGLMISLGAGLYEELLFRVLLVSALLLAARHLLGLGPVAATLLAVMGGALIFAAFHYVGPYGDQVELGSFVFRTVAGLAFSALYVTRGFGITAWTHALYDVFLITARG
jgi:hypothetical protein